MGNDFKLNLEQILARSNTDTINQQLIEAAQARVDKSGKPEIVELGTDGYQETRTNKPFVVAVVYPGSEPVKFTKPFDAVFALSRYNRRLVPNFGQNFHDKIIIENPIEKEIIPNKLIMNENPNRFFDESTDPRNREI